MTAPVQPLAENSRPLLERLRDAAESAGVKVRKKDKAPRAPKAEKASNELRQLGLLAVNAKSPASELEDFVHRLWHSLDGVLEERHKEWEQILLYCANEQLLAYHRERRQWIPRRTLPWRIRSIYNIMQKAVNVRVSRLVDNKPMVTVQAQSADADDVERAEYKETLFWYLWERLYLHMKIAQVRRWAAKAGSGYLKVGWDPDAGASRPATMKRAKWIEQPMVGPDGVTPMPDPATGQTITQRVFAGIEEYYVDAKGNDLGPVTREVPDPNGGHEPTIEKIAAPETVAWISDGEADVSVRPPFNLRWDQYADAIHDSWYVQDGELLPLSKIAAMHPDKLDELLEATPASEDDRALRWRGLTPALNVTPSDLPHRAKNAQGDSTDHQPLDREYLYLETWIFPKNALLKRLWGEKGCRIVTVGGHEIERTELPEWALQTCPFIQFIDTLEEGNSTGRPAMRDIVPLQDDINRSRSMRAERGALLSRLLLWAPAQHGINIKALAGMSGALVTTRSQAHKPEPLNLNTGDPGIREFEQDSLAAAADLGNMNDASTGKLPSAGIAAKAIYALQYADERSISEASTLQDMALKRLAESLDAVVRVEYQEARKIRLVGEDRSYMVEHEISPSDLAVDVDYTFTPGSMLSRQKEAVKNEMLELMKAGLVDGATVRKHLNTAVPDVFRLSFSLQEAHARRVLRKVLKASQPVQGLQPQPYDDPAVHCAIIEELALTAKWELLAKWQQDQLTQLWQAYKLKQQMAMQPQGPPGAPPGAPPQGGAPPPPPGPIGAPAPPEAPQGAQQLEQQATTTMQAPEPG